MLKYHADLDINQHNSISGLPTYLPTYNYDDTREYYVECIYCLRTFTGLLRIQVLAITLGTLASK
jgi:hypothetical protein